MDERDELAAGNEALEAERDSLMEQVRGWRDADLQTQTRLAEVTGERDRLLAEKGDVLRRRDEWEAAARDAVAERERLQRDNERYERDLERERGESAEQFMAVANERDRLFAVLAAAEELLRVGLSQPGSVAAANRLSDVALRARAEMETVPAQPTEVERKAKAFDDVRRLWWEFCDVEEGRAALRCLGEFIGEWEHYADRRDRDSEAAVVNHRQQDDSAKAQPAGVAAPPWGHAGGAPSRPAGPPGGLSPLGAAVWKARGGPPPPHLGAGASAGYVSPAFVGVDPAAPDGDRSVDAHIEVGPAGPRVVIDTEHLHCCRWHASGGSRYASCSDIAARPYGPRGP
jgi:hypothetical protein